MNRYSVRIMLVALMVSAQLVAKPIKIVTDSGAYIWIESTLLSPTLGDTFIKSIEKKGQFQVQVPDTILASISDLFTLARSAYLTKSDSQDTQRQVYEYVTRSFDEQRLHEMVALLDFVQQYFTSDFQYGLAYGVAFVAQDTELDLSQTSITPDNQFTVALAQRTLHPYEHSIASFLKTYGNNQKLLSEDKTTLQLVGLGLTSVAGIDQFPRSVKHVDLSHNKIDFDAVESTLISQAFPQLETLNISHNLTKRLHAQLAAQSSELTKLSAKDNQISQIDPDLLSVAPKLKRVDLRNNALQNLPESFLINAPESTKLYLKGNPLSQIFRANMPDHLSRMMLNSGDAQLKKRSRTDISELRGASPSKRPKE